MFVVCPLRFVTRTTLYMYLSSFQKASISTSLCSGQGGLNLPLSYLLLLLPIPFTPASCPFPKWFLSAPCLLQNRTKCCEIFFSIYPSSHFLPHSSPPPAPVPPGSHFPVPTRYRSHENILCIMIFMSVIKANNKLVFCFLVFFSCVMTQIMAVT